MKWQIPIISSSVLQFQFAQRASRIKSCTCFRRRWRELLENGNAWQLLRVPTDWKRILSISRRNQCVLRRGLLLLRKGSGITIPKCSRYSGWIPKALSFNKRISGQRMLTGKEFVCGQLEMRNQLFRESTDKRLPRNQRITKSLSLRWGSTGRIGRVVLWSNTGMLIQWVSLWVRSESCRTTWIPWLMQNRFPCSYCCSQLAALERPTLPVRFVTVPSSRTVPGRDSGLPRNTRNIMGISGNVYERLPAQEGPPQDIFENSENLASSSRGVRPELTEQTVTSGAKMRLEQQDSPNSKNYPSQWR